MQKQKKPSNKASTEPRRGTNSAAQNAKPSRPKQDHKGQGNRAGKPGAKG